MSAGRFIWGPLIAFLLLFGCGYAGADPPQVVSTDPALGATGVSPDISSLSITFSAPMNTAADSGLGAWYFSYGWGTDERSWSADGKTLTIAKSNAGTPLPAGQTVIFILNWSRSARFQDAEGNILPEYTFYFTVEGDKETLYENLFNATITKFPADSSKGFHWPYYLSIPNALANPTTLFVEPNNSGYPALEPVFHDAKATELLYSRTAIVNNTWKLNVPILIPVFPRTYDDYIQSLNLWLPADCNCPELERADLQLAAMIEDAQERLRAMGYIVDRKVFMNGFSASCGFTVGFAMLHPDAVKAAACGGGLPDDYDPQRISTLEAATSTQIDLAAYFSAPLYLYLGDQDGNYDADLWLSTRQFYESAGANAKLVLYAGVGHAITDQIWSDLRSFFEHHKAVGDTVQKAYIGYYQRPADPAGLIWWIESLGRSGGNLNAIIEAYAHSEESRALYGSIDGGNIAAVINDIYRALFNRDADAAGRDWYVAEFNKGAFTAATIMLNVLYGAQNEDLATLNNKLTAANLFTRTIDPELDGKMFQATYEGNEDAAAARYYLGLVTASSATVPTQSQAAEYIRTYIADPDDGIHTLQR